MQVDASGMLNWLGLVGCCCFCCAWPKTFRVDQSILMSSFLYFSIRSLLPKRKKKNKYTAESVWFRCLCYSSRQLIFPLHIISTHSAPESTRYTRHRAGLHFSLFVVFVCLALLELFTGVLVVLLLPGELLRNERCSR